MNIGIVNISVGNIGSVASAVRFLGAQPHLVERPDDLAGKDLIVLAGVGHFQTSAARLVSTGFADALRREVLDGGQPLLGICLGMQLFCDSGHEGGAATPGLGWIPGQVVGIDKAKCKVPHMGWNTVLPRETNLFRGLEYSEFYFMHSYHLVLDDPQYCIATVEYDGQSFVSAVRRKNIFGVQFHPEKSQSSGLGFLNNLMEEIR